MRRLAWVWLFVAGCKTQANGRYCDENTACPASFPFCDVARNECTAGPDAAVPMDLSGAADDLSSSDAGVPDAAPDQSPSMCSGPGDCTGAAPICDNGSCRGCSGDGECPGAHCRPSGQCAQCRSGGDCPSPSPVCDATGACVKCALHADCASGVCILDGAQAGACADAFDVAWVDNGGQTIANCKLSGLHDGAPAHPYCDIVDAILSGRPFIRVIGHLGAPYTPLAFAPPAGGYSVIIVGPGVDAAQPATLFDGNNIGVAVTVNGGVPGNADIVLDGVEIGDRTTLSNQTGIFCNNGGTGAVSVALRHGAVRNFNNTGVAATNCKLEISDSTVNKNNNIGIALAGSTVTLTNDVITANTGSAAVNCSNNGGTLGDLTLTGNTITNNGGVGVNFANSNVTATGNTISGHSGAGVACQTSVGGSSTWTGNTITYNAGGVSDVCPMTLSGNTITFNTVVGVNLANTTVTLTNNTIGNNTDIQVESSACTLTLDGNSLFGASGGANNDGVNVFNGTVFTMSNNLIYANARNGVIMSPGSVGKFIFNTVAHNGGAGIDCGFNPVAPKPIEASIVWGNHQTAGTQFPNVSCLLLTTVTGTDSYAGGLQTNPDFVRPSPSPSPFDYHLKKVDSANAGCCYDKVAGPLDGGTAPLPDHDVDGEHRPAGIGWDVGGDEAQ
jgi:Right handed beta helix region